MALGANLRGRVGVCLGTARWLPVDLAWCLQRASIMV